MVDSEVQSEHDLTFLRASMQPDSAKLSPSWCNLTGGASRIVPLLVRSIHAAQSALPVICKASMKWQREMNALPSQVCRRWNKCLRGFPYKPP